MIGRARDAGIPFAWVAGDEVYGGNPGLRGWLEEQKIPYVMAVACSDVIPVAGGGMRAGELAALVPGDGWQRLSCADGSKGPRLYDWALIAAGSPEHHLLVRRSLQPGEKSQLELAFFRCWSPRPVTLPELAALPARAGELRTASPRPRARPGWATTRSASTGPGTGTPPWPCSPTPSSPSPPGPPGLPPRPPASGHEQAAPAGKGT